jgi:ribonucleoside-diphosphate reductase alpha chain
LAKLSENATKVAESRYFSENEDWQKLAIRQGNAIASVEKDKEKWSKIFSEMIYNMEFIPAGRILRNAGKIRPSMLNCGCIGIGDSIEAIGDTIRDALISWSYGMGIGIDFSPLREKDRPLLTKEGKSSGMLSFLDAINYVAKTIETGGQRRSGLLGMLRVSHPEIFEFIRAKRIDGSLSYTNLSVAIDDSFLKAVENDANWNLTFAGQTVKVVKARDVWDEIVENMIFSGDPGLINYTNLVKNNSFYFQAISACNLCSEIPLPISGTCDLGALVLPSFISNKNMNWKKLETAVYNSVRFLDNVLDINHYALPAMETVAKEGRRIGLGCMGLHDYLMAKQIRYGSERSLFEIERLYKFIRDAAYEASISLAVEKGAFPKFSKNEFTSASYVKKLPAKIRLDIKEHGIRNVCSISGQPTGTTSLLADVSSGVEPVFSLAYKRVDRVSERYYVHPRLLEWINSGEKEKPEWLVDTSDLKPEDHLEVQVAINKYLDNSISKTINCPSTITKEDLSKLLLEYSSDLRGVTIYRDGSKEGQVLNKIDLDEVKKYIKKDKIATNMTETDTKCSTGACEV